MKKLKIGQKIKLKNLEDCEIFQQPVISIYMEKYFGKDVTFKDMTQKGYIHIYEDKGYHVYHKDWFEDQLKVALEKSINVWGYMYKTNCSKEVAITQLYPGEYPENNCFLCDVCKCDECIAWTNKGGFCYDEGSPYGNWNENKSKENTLLVLNKLKSEYIRLFGEQILKEKNPRFYKSLVENNIVNEYWEYVITLHECFFSSFSSGEEKYDELRVTLMRKIKNIEKEAWHFTGDINFNQICFDNLKENNPAWMVVGKEKAYIGMIRNPSIYVLMYLPDIIATIDESYIINMIDGYPYEIIEIPINLINFFKERLKKFSTYYTKWAATLDKHIKDRDRKKSKDRFKVFTF